MDKPCNNEELFAAYIDRRLSDSELKEFEEHLSRCPYCLGQLIIIWNEIREFELETNELEAFGPAGVQSGRNQDIKEESNRYTFLKRIMLFTENLVQPKQYYLKKAVNSGITALLAALFLSVLFMQILTSYSWDPGVIDARKEIAQLLQSQNVGVLRVAGYESSPAAETPVVRGTARNTIGSGVETIRKRLLNRIAGGSKDYRNLHLLGDLLLANNQQHLAILRYREALLLKPDDPELLNNLAVAYFRSGSEDIALRCLLRASSIKEAPKEVFFNLTVVYKDTGKKAEMKRAAEEYLSRDPSSPWADRLVKILQDSTAF